MRYETNGLEIIIYLDKELYSNEVIHKCFYWYGANYSVDISMFSEKEYKVTLLPKNNSLAAGLIEKIRQDLVDYKLREIVTHETKVVRELIIAKAFAYYAMDDNPVTDVSDPVGFNPYVISQ